MRDADKVHNFLSWDDTECYCCCWLLMCPLHWHCSVNTELLLSRCMVTVVRVAMVCTGLLAALGTPLGWAGSAHHPYFLIHSWNEERWILQSQINPDQQLKSVLGVEICWKIVAHDMMMLVVGGWSWWWRLLPGGYHSIRCTPLPGDHSETSSAYTHQASANINFLWVTRGEGGRGTPDTHCGRKIFLLSPSTIANGVCVSGRTLWMQMMSVSWVGHQLGLWLMRWAPLCHIGHIQIIFWITHKHTSLYLQYAHKDNIL